MLLPVHIIYASVSGNVEVTCEYIAAELAPLGLSPELHRVELVDLELLIKHNLFILATSTWEHGRINPYWDKLLREVKQLDLSGKFAGFVGLGDRRYEPVAFCAGVDQLHQTFTDKGIYALDPVLKIDGSPYSQLRETVHPWLLNFLQQVGEFSLFKT